MIIECVAGQMVEVFSCNTRHNPPVGVRWDDGFEYYVHFADLALPNGNLGTVGLAGNVLGTAGAAAAAAAAGGAQQAGLPADLAARAAQLRQTLANLKEAQNAARTRHAAEAEAAESGGRFELTSQYGSTSLTVFGEFVEVFSELICCAQEFVREIHGGERSVASLRDVAR